MKNINIPIHESKTKIANFKESRLLKSYLFSMEKDNNWFNVLISLIDIFETPEVQEIIKSKIAEKQKASMQNLKMDDSE